MTILPERLHRLFLLMRCLFASLFLGKAKTISRNPSSVIVVLTGKLGDIVCGTPVLRALREYLPHTRIIVAGESRLLRPLLSDSGLVDDYIDLDENGAVARIKKYHAEVALVTGPSFVSVALLYLSGIPLIVAPRIEGGFCPFETRPYKILQRFIKTFPYRMGEYAPRERLKCLEPLGIVSSDTKKLLGFSETALEKINQFFIHNGVDIKKDFVVGMSPSAGNKIKEWPVERFGKVADYIQQKKSGKIVIISGPNDHDLAQKMKNAMETSVIDTTGMWNIDELKAVISKLDLFISVDTGPIYMAEAFNIPTIDIIGPMDEREQPPIGKLHRIVVAPRKTAELHIMNARVYNKKEAERQTKDITTKMVIDEIDLLIEEIKR